MNSVLFLLYVAAVCGGGGGGGCVVWALVGVRASVPEAVLSGRPATLGCQFDLEGDTLYSVKWYKGRQEFYRYTQRETPPIKTFPVPGLRELRVQVSESNASRVSLAEAAPPLAGRYSCEVSADAPSFQTALVTGHMRVVVAPADRPRVEGVRRRYAVGDTLRARCTSALSQPAANVTWAINGQTVDRNYVKVYNVVQENQGDLETSSSIIEKVLTLQDFNSKGRLKIRCTASILSAYWQTTEKSAAAAAAEPHHHHHHHHHISGEGPPTTADRGDDHHHERGRVPSAGGIVVCWPLLLPLLLPASLI